MGTSVTKCHTAKGVSQISQNLLQDGLNNNNNVTTYRTAQKSAPYYLNGSKYTEITHFLAFLASHSVLHDDKKLYFNSEGNPIKTNHLKKD